MCPKSIRFSGIVSRRFGIAIALVIAMNSISTAWALIMGGDGNEPIHDPGWPTGAAKVFNTTSRIAYWEGPPFGGGQYHSECRGDTAAFQAVLNDFAKIDLPKKRIVLHDGVGQSFWLNMNREKDKKEASKIDWVFVVWQPKRLNQILGNPFLSRRMGNPDDLMIAKIDVYTGGSIRWNEITVPDEIDVVDKRLEAHGFKTTDGTVLEGKVTDVASGEPLRAKMVIEQIEPQTKGGYEYTKLTEVESADDGHWILKNAPQAWCRLVLKADGYAPRVIGHLTIDDQPTWSEHNSSLAEAGKVSGRVVDQEGKPLADVDVRIDDLDTKKSTGYDVPGGDPVKTDREGRFVFEGVPVGSGKIWLHKPGYVRPGLGLKIEIPSANAKLVMVLAAKLHISVDFSESKRAGDYIVHCEPEGGQQIGKWSGDGNIGADNDITYESIPPGRYTVKGRPNPGSTNQETKPIPVELKGGETTEVTIKAK